MYNLVNLLFPDPVQAEEIRNKLAVSFSRKSSFIQIQETTVRVLLGFGLSPIFREIKLPPNYYKIEISIEDYPYGFSCSKERFLWFEWWDVKIMQDI